MKIPTTKAFLGGMFSSDIREMFQSEFFNTEDFFSVFYLTALYPSVNAWCSLKGHTHLNKPAAQAAGLFKCVCPFSGHHVVKVPGNIENPKLNLHSWHFIVESIYVLFWDE